MPPHQYRHATAGMMTLQPGRGLLLVLHRILLLTDTISEELTNTISEECNKPLLQLNCRARRCMWT